jgi:hypothetical protein
MPQINFDAFVAFTVVAMDAPSTFSSNRAFGDSGFKPPNGRALLTSYCTLLL